MVIMFAPMEVIPPSPKKIPWRTTTRVIIKIAAYGEPRTIAARAAPTTCPLTPPGMIAMGSAILSVWIAKIPAARTATNGILSSLNSRLAHRRESIIKNSAMIQNMTANERGKNPSGMCMMSPGKLLRLLNTVTLCD